MSKASRYSDEQIEVLLSELAAAVLEKHRTLTDLLLMILGNMVINVIRTHVAPKMPGATVKSFTDALHASLPIPDTY